MSLKKLFEQDELDPQLESLDLMTSYHSTMRFLELFQAAIFSKEHQSRSVLSVYAEFLHSQGLINTPDDYPSVISGHLDNPNEIQAIRNLKFPMGLGSLSAYMSMNLGIAREIAGDKIPNKSTEKLKSEWFLDKFDIIKDELHEKPTIRRVLKRLRNAVSHHNFKLRIPLSLVNERDIRDQVEVTFYDSDKSNGNDFYAKARFRTVENLMEKLRSTVYEFHTCPPFEEDIYKDNAIVDYVSACFKHFSRSYARRGLKFESLTMLNPIDAYRVQAQTGCIEISRSDTLLYKASMKVNDKNCEPQYLEIPFLANNRQNEIMIEDDLYDLGASPMDWMLNHAKSPLCRLEKKIISMLDDAIETQNLEATSPSTRDT